MRKFIVWPQGVPDLGIPAGHRDELTPLTYAEFEKMNRWTGTNDQAYDHFLRHNKFSDISEDSWHPYTEEAFNLAEIQIEPGEPVIDWKLIYGA